MTAATSARCSSIVRANPAMNASALFDSPWNTCTRSRSAPCTFAISGGDSRGELPEGDEAGSNVIERNGLQLCASRKSVNERLQASLDCFAAHGHPVEQALTVEVFDRRNARRVRLRLQVSPTLRAAQAVVGPHRDSATHHLAMSPRRGPRPARRCSRNCRLAAANTSRIAR